MAILIIIRNITVAVLVIAGCFFMVLGTIGLLRLPDAYTRLHPSTICDTMGNGLIILAMIIYGGLSPNILRMLFIVFLLFMSSAVNGHAIGRAIYKEQTRQNARLNVLNDWKTGKNSRRDNHHNTNSE
jgi:multicomponent Na+:H+ antiporter subunit G